VPIPQWDQAQLRSGRYTVRPTLWLFEEPGVPIDITDHLLGFTVSASMQSPSVDVVFDLIRGGTGLRSLDSGATDSALGSLSPYVDPGGYLFASGRPAIDPVIGFVLIISIDNNFENLNQAVLVDGVIDAVDVAPGGGQIRLTCRDRAARFQDILIPQTRIYGEAGGREAALVMGDMLTDAGLNPAELVSRIDPFDDFLVQPYPVQGVTLLEALRTLAQASGRDVRTFSTGAQCDLTYYDPGRARGLYDLLVIPQATVGIKELSFGIADVRNSVDVWYPADNGLPQGPIHSEDAASIARYGLRHFEVFLNRLEMIRDEARAQAFADAAIADQKDPFVSHKIEMPFNPSILLNDIHLYSGRWAENVTDLQLAVMSYTHTWRAAQKGGDGVARTTVSASGKPRAALRDYRRSVPPKTIATTLEPTTEYAPEGTLIMVTDSIAAP
jgi:hypothetical protein